MIRKILQIEQSSKTKRVKIIYTLKPKHKRKFRNFWWIISKSLKKIRTHGWCWTCGREFWGWLAMGSAKVIRLEDSALSQMGNTPWKFAFVTNDQGVTAHLWTKAQVVQAGPLFTQIEAASKKSNHKLRRPRQDHFSHRLEQHQFGGNKGFTQSTELRNFLNSKPIKIQTKQ